jgi:hypothetical protein
MQAPPTNCAVDCYSREPIDKHSLLKAMSERFGLNYEVTGGGSFLVNATGAKPHYYSLNRRAAQFGYEPIWSSLDCITTETMAILEQIAP